MRRNLRSKFQPDQQLEHANFNDVVYTGYAYLRSPTNGLNGSQNIMDIQEEYVTNFGVVVRYKSCCKMKI